MDAVAPEIVGDGVEPSQVQVGVSKDKVVVPPQRLGVQLLRRWSLRYELGVAKVREHRVLQYVVVAGLEDREREEHRKWAGNPPLEGSSTV